MRVIAIQNWKYGNDVLVPCIELKAILDVYREIYFFFVVFICYPLVL